MRGDVAQMPEASARRGTANDLVWLARLYEKLDDVRRHALVGAAGRLAAEHPAARNDIGASWVAGLRGLIGLLAVYSALESASKCSVLTEAAELVAVQAMSALAAASPSPDEVSDWLTRLARDCAPRDELILRAAEFSLDPYEALFSEGPLATALCPSEDELDLAEGVYAGYVTIAAHDSASEDLPVIAKVLGIKVPTSQYQEWNGDEWIVNEAAHEAEIRRRCVLECAGLVASWRSNFFEALLSGRQPRTATECT